MLLSLGYTSPLERQHCRKYGEGIARVGSAMKAAERQNFNVRGTITATFVFNADLLTYRHW